MRWQNCWKHLRITLPLGPPSTATLLYKLFIIRLPEVVLLIGAMLYFKAQKRNGNAAVVNLKLKAACEAGLKCVTKHYRTNPIH